MTLKQGDGLQEQISNGVAALDLVLPDGTGERLAAFVRLLEKWNKTYNLTAVRDPLQMVPLHILDSLSVLQYIDADVPLLDVGSGGGMPAIPVAIACPGLAVTSLDTNSKKTAFQRQAAIELRLEKLDVVNARVEDYTPDRLFPQIVSRAFAETADFIRWTRHLLAPGGRWLAMKGQLPDAELARLPDGVMVEAIHPLQVPTLDGERHLVILRERA